MTHYVYVLHDSARVVLYVGCTQELSRRISRHRRRPWGFRIDHVDLYLFENRAEAETVEAALIAELSPEFNAMDSPVGERADRGARLEQLREVFRQQGPMTQHEAREALRQAGADRLHSWFGMAMNRLRVTGELVEVGRAEVPDRKYDPRIYSARTIEAHQRRAGELAAERKAAS